MNLRIVFLCFSTPSFSLLPPTPSPHSIPGTLLSLSPLATTTVSPNESWYRPNPNTYQNTTVITIDRARTNITLGFSNGSITVSNATQTSVEASTNYSQSYVVFNNSVPAFAYANVSFFVDGSFYANATANSSGFVSFNYTGIWSSHIFEWVTDNMRYDVNHDGIVDIFDFTVVSQHVGEITVSPYPDYDVNEDGGVDMLDLLLVFLHLGAMQ